MAQRKNSRQAQQQGSQRRGSQQQGSQQRGSQQRGSPQQGSQQLGWDEEHERQYENIKEQTERYGSSEERAKEIAARTVNKNRAQSGHARQQSKTATEDISPQRRGGIRSGNRYGPGGRTKEQLYEDARKNGVAGRSKMTKSQLEDALQGG